MILSEKIRAVIKRYSMLSPGERVAVAFSGGADSVALLYFLANEGYDVLAIHVNHGIRGDEADGDEDFCRYFCEKRDIPFFCVHIDVPAEAKKTGEGLEETARRLRYAAIEDIMTKSPVTKTATAHHADDNIETVIFNLTRGSSIKGAGGIPPVRDCYIRPLIECTREEILSYCKENSLDFVTDSTNYDTDYTRNFIRHRISPLLREINPSAATAFANFSASARRDSDLLDSMAGDIPKDISRKELGELHPALLTRFIYLRMEELGHIPQRRSTEQLISAISAGNEYKCVDMGENIKAVCDRQRVYFVKDGIGTYLNNTPLDEGENILGDFGIIYIAKSKEYWQELKNIYNLSIYTTIGFDKIKGNIFARSRIDGDSYRYAGMTRTLKKLFNSKKLTVYQRNRLPIICDKEGIVWVPGFAAADNVKTNKENENILYIGYKG